MSPAHRSRTAWPDEREPETSKADAPAFRLPSSVRVSLIAMGACMVLMAIALGALLYYVFGRTQYRDARDEAVQEQFRTGMCDILDSLPEGPFLQPIRDKYGCGPGIPREELTPEQQAGLREFASGIDAPAEPSPIVKPRQAPQDEPPTPTPSPRAPAPAEPPQEPTGPAASAPGLPPVQAPAGPTPAASPSAPPLVDLNPITDPLCTALGICI